MIKPRTPKTDSKVIALMLGKRVCLFRPLEVISSSIAISGLVISCCHEEYKQRNFIALVSPNLYFLKTPFPSLSSHIHSQSIASTTYSSYLLLSWLLTSRPRLPIYSPLFLKYTLFTTECLSKYNRQHFNWKISTSQSSDFKLLPWYQNRK